MQLWLGIDVASRAAHQASLADESGRFFWSGHRFRTAAEDLERLWAMLPERGADAEVLVILEPTRNAWVPLAAWFRRHGARVVLVPPERSADLRDYYHKHTKSDRLDSRLLARLPLLHPEGLHDEHGLGPGDPLRRATRLRQSLVKRRTKSLARLDALLELLGPKWLEAFRAALANKTPLRFLAAGYACPNTVKRLGRARLGRFLYRHSRGRWGAEQAAALLSAAEETLALWEDTFDFDQLAEDIAVEARLALTLTDEVAALDERIALLLEEADPAAILTSAPGVGAVTGAQILARLGDPNRFRSLAGVRSFSGLVPSLNASGVSGRHGRPTRRGDAALAARYQRLMVSAGKHHNSALCHIATTLLTRVVACWRRGERYVIRDCDGRPVSVAEGRSIVAERYSVPAEVRRQRLGSRAGTRKRTGRRGQESQSAPAPARPLPTLQPLAGA